MENIVWYCPSCSKKNKLTYTEAYPLTQCQYCGSKVHVYNPRHNMPNQITPQAAREAQLAVEAKVQERAKKQNIEFKQRLQQMKEYNQSERYIPSSVKQRVWRRDGGRCVRCCASTDLEFDHVIPVSKGGSSTENNLQILCARCNRNKHAYIM